MKAIQIRENMVYHDERPNADPLYVDRNGRAILFTLKPGQSIKQHKVPQSPFYVIVLQGHGLFKGKDGVEQRFGPDDFIVFDPGEEHSVRAENEELAFLGVLHGEESNLSERIGGEIGRHQKATKKL